MTAIPSLIPRRVVSRILVDHFIGCERYGMVVLMWAYDNRIVVLYVHIMYIVEVPNEIITHQSPTPSAMRLQNSCSTATLPTVSNSKHDNSYYLLPKPLQYIPIQTFQSFLWKFFPARLVDGTITDRISGWRRPCAPQIANHPEWRLHPDPSPVLLYIVVCNAKQCNLPSSFRDKVRIVGAFVLNEKQWNSIIFVRSAGWYPQHNIR